MKYITVAILERTEVYGRRLAAYISQHEDSPFVVQLYLEHPAQGEVWREADVILVTSSLADTYNSLLETDSVIVLDEDGRGAEGDEQFIYKYQSAAVIYERLIAFCMDRSGKRMMGNGRVKREFTVDMIYTPTNGEKVTGAVMTLCRQWAAQCRLLYLNLEPVPMFEEMLGESGRQEGVSDLIYYIKQRRNNIGARIGMIAEKGEFDYLRPAGTPAEIGEMNGEEWQCCLDCIRDETDYEKVVLDFGTTVPPADIFDRCTVCKIVYGKNQWEKKMISRFRQMMEKVMGEDFAGKIEVIEIEDAAMNRDMGASYGMMAE